MFAGAAEQKLLNHLGVTAAGILKGYNFLKIVAI
jgi:hypothetical protein